jgi:bifunctional non-homologous end joining protein LigD
MKAKLVGSRPPGSWIYEIKFDGYRALALRGGNETRILSRNQKDLGKKFPTIAESIANSACRTPSLTESTMLCWS